MISAGKRWRRYNDGETFISELCCICCHLVALLVNLTIRYCQLNSRKRKSRDSGKDELPFVILSINNRLDANRHFPSGESRFHYCPVTASSIQMSPHSEV